MKKYVLTAVLFVSAVLVRGGVTLPDAGGYVCDTDAAYSWEEISADYGGSGTLINWAANRSGNHSYTDAVPLGFTFSYYGGQYDSVYIMSAGWMSFTDRERVLPSSNAFPDSTDECAGVIAPLAMTFDIDDWADGCYYRTLGTAPDRRFIVEWSDAYSTFNLDYHSFQAVLYERTGQIRFRYNYVADNNTSSQPEPSHAGIEAPDERAGTDLGYATAYNGSGNISDESAYLLGKPAVLTAPYADAVIEDTVTLAWNVITGNPAAEIALYHDNGTDTTGTLITDTVTAGGAGTYTWQPAGFDHTDTLHIYAVLTDSGETTVVYAPGRVAFPVQPFILLAGPAADTVAGGTFDLIWTGLAADSAASAALYYDDGTDTSGTLITDGLAAAGGTYGWPLSGFDHTDSLYVYAVLTDGGSRFVDYAPGRLTFPFICSLQVTSPAADEDGSGTYTITWDEVCNDDAAVLEWYYDNGTDTSGILFDSVTAGDPDSLVFTTAGFDIYDTLYMYGVLRYPGQTVTVYAPGRLIFPVICSLLVTSPAAEETVAAGVYTVAWNMICNDSAAVLKLYHDDGIDTTGTVVDSFLSGDPESLVLDLSGFAAGDTVYIYGILDAAGAAAVSYAAGRIIIPGTGMTGSGIPSGSSPQMRMYDLTGRLLPGLSPERADKGIYIVECEENGRLILKRTAVIR